MRSVEEIGIMNYAIILAGGVGNRMNLKMPKQYLEVNKKPIIAYTLEKFEDCELIDKIIIVSSDEWNEYLYDIIDKYHISKFASTTKNGLTRQLSILNGLKMIKECGAKEEDIVIIHDSVRPLVSDQLIKMCIIGCGDADGVLPAIKVKDTVYKTDGEKIVELLNRDLIVSGQSPEAFVFGKYYDANIKSSEDDLKKINGSSEIAFNAGLKIKIIPGDENNFKITTIGDLELFEKKVRIQ